MDEWRGTTRPGRHPGYQHRVRPDGASACGLVRADSPNWGPATDQQLRCPRCEKAAPWAEHGTPLRYHNGGCRCDLCRKAANEVARQRRGRLAEQRGNLAPPGTVHGRAAYSNHHCRCDTCTEDHCLVARESRARRRQSGTVIDGRWVSTSAKQHGKSSTYQNYGCRCRPCTDAQSRDQLSYERDRRQRQAM